jgi:hypothetical protein
MADQTSADLARYGVRTTRSLNWPSPAVEAAIRVRDADCVYCHKVMVDPKSTPLWADWATIEHTEHMTYAERALHLSAEDFAIACHSCNSGRGARDLLAFVTNRGIADTVAPVIKAALARRSAGPPVAG